MAREDVLNEPILQASKIGPVRPVSSCVDGNANELCWPSSIDPRDVFRLDGLGAYRRRLVRDEILFRRDQSFSMVYAIRFGHLKSSRPDHRGQPHVTAFYMSGDLLGLDAICTGRHVSTVCALDDCEVYEIPYGRLQEELHDSALLMQRFHSALSQEIVREQAILLYADMKGAERLASLLLDLSARYAERGYSGLRFRLRMSRADIGNYLGLTIESISRLFARFRSEGWIALDKREIELLNYDGLVALLRRPSLDGLRSQQET